MRRLSTPGDEGYGTTGMLLDDAMVMKQPDGRIYIYLVQQR